MTFAKSLTTPTGAGIETCWARADPDNDIAATSASADAPAIGTLTAPRTVRATILRIVSPLLISLLMRTPIYPMKRIQVNFSAAIFLSLVTGACGPSKAAPAASESAPSPTASTTSATSAQAISADPIVAAADRGRVLGDTAAKTWVIVASDFQCPFCKSWHDETYPALVAEYVKTGKVKLAYINFPLSQHKNAVVTAEAAMCAGAQGKFWEYHDGLFDTQAQWAPMPDPRSVLESIATRAGVNNASWRQCLDGGVMRPLIEADNSRAKSAGVQSTPSFLIGNTVFLGSQPIEALRPALDSAIARN